MKRTKFLALSVSAAVVCTPTANALPDTSTRPGAVQAGLARPAGQTSPAPAARGRTLPEAVGARRGVRQMVTITSKSWSTTRARLKAWRRDARGNWHLVRGPIAARIGYGGWVRARQRVQSTGTTPTGRYRIPYAFGRLSDPGARLRYRKFDRNDWWPYEPRDPATYNVYQFRKDPQTRWRKDKAERLWDYYYQYAYGAVVTFNLPSGIHYSKRRGQRVASDRADTSRGGGIFLHVNGKGATAGCMSVSRTHMRWLLRWLRPGKHPRLVMGPRQYLVRR